MPIRAQLFDGTVLEFPDNTDPGVIQSTAKRMTSEIRSRMPDASPAPKEGMGAAFMGGLESLGSRLRTGVEAIVSPEEAARRGLERGEAIRREYAPGASLQRVKDVYAERGILPAAGEAISQIPTALAEQAPNIAATIASAKIGAMGGTAIAPGIGTVIGGVGGALVPSLTQLFGSNVERQAEVQRERGEPIDISRGKALAAAVPGAALEAASTFVPLGRAMVGKLLGPQGAKLLERGSTEATEALAKESLLKVVGKGAAIGAGVEIPTEFTQQMLERLQAGLPVTSEDALTEYGEAMYGAGLVGGPFGAVGRVGQRSLARQKIAQEPPPEIAPEAATPTKPAAQYFDEPSPLENPYGNITADLMPDVAKEINAARAKRKQTSLDSFSIEDAVNAGLPQERVDSILSGALQRAGIAPDLQIAPEDIYDTARIAGVNTEQPGFPDFLRRATGSDNPEQMSPVQRVAAIGAIQSLPEGVDTLPTGTNARSFTEAQYKAGLKAIKATPAGGATRDELLANIQKSGVKNVQDAMSVLQTAIRDGNVEGVAAPAYAVADASGNIIGRYDDQQQAQDRADRLNGSVTEFAQTRYFPSEQAAKPAEPKAPVLPEMQALQQQLAPVLRRFGLEDVGLKVVKSLGQEGADGAYANRLIQVAMGAENPMGVMRHESIHALKELGAFKPREWRALEKKAQTEWVDKFIRQPGLYDRYQDVYQQQTGSLAGFDEYIAEEAIAEAFKYFDQTKPPVGLIGNLFNRLRNFFASLRNAMQGAGFQTAEDVLGRIEEGKVRRQREAQAAAPKFSMAKETDEQFFLREQLKPKARQVIFEIAPNPDDADLSAEWNNLPEERRQEISRKLKNTMTKKVLDVMGARGRIADQVGSYENDTNASFALFLEKGNALDVAKGLGFAFSQKSMMVVSPNKARGMSKMGAVTLEIGDKNFGQIQDIYNTLRKIDLNGQSPVNGQTTANGRMTILNDPEWTGVETDELADIVDAALGYKYNVFTDDVYAAFPEAKDYDYASKENDPADEAGDIRERLRSVRDEASEAIRQEIRSKVGSRDGRGRDKGRGNTPLAGAPLVAGATGPDPRIVAVAEKYAKDNGIPLERQSIYVDVDPDFSKSIAQAYDEMPHAPNDPAVKEAYQDLIRQTTAQYKALEDAGYKFYFYDETNDPYDGNPWNAMRELRAKKTMGVFATEAGFGSGATELNVDDNPLLAETGIEWPYGSLDGQKKRVLANDLFRAVHDAFGHGIEGAGFRAVGEENAWQAHAKLFKGPALGALTSETRGQNSWLNYGKYGEKNQTAKVQDTVFADQKTGLMPEWTWQERVAPSGGIKPVTTETIVIDGVIRPTRNSEGRLIFPTEEGLRNFWKWFGDSAIVDNKGRPVVMYHGTARDIEEFIPKQADAIFVTPNPSFAEGFGPASEDYMVRNLFNKTTEEERYEILMTAAKAAYADKRINRNEFNRIAREYRELDSTYGFIPSSIEDDVYAEVLNRLPSRSNILSLYVSSKNPFDFKNPDHVEAIVEAANMAGNEIDPKSIKDIKLGRWAEIEGDVVQNAIRNAGFDGFYVREGGETNLAVYDSSQLKSAIGNVGAFSPKKKGIKFSLAQTNTPEFKRWFGDSKVVDADGKPLVVYHGTSKDKDFTSFNVGMRGAWFTSSPEEASMYSKENDSQGYKYEGGKFIAKNTASRVMPVYLSIQNPYDLTKDDLEKLKGGSNYAAAQKDIFTKARLQGFDGIDLGDGIWVVLKSPNQIKSAIGNRGTFDLTKKDIRYSISGGKAFALDPTTSKDNFIYLLQDDKIDLKRVNDGIYKTGKKIGDRWNAYEKEETYYGKSAERIKQFATRELHQVTNKMQSAGISLPEMDDYLLARHAPEANAYLRTINPDPNQNAGMSDAEAAAYMQSIPASKRVALERIAKDVDAMTKGTRDLMVEYGLESKKTIDQWDKTYKHYVPLFREETEGKPLSAGRGFSIRGDTSKRRTGSTRKVVNVLANIALQREQVIARGERNRVGNSLYGMVLLYPNPDFWSVIRPDKMTKDQIRAELFKLGIDPATVDEMAERPVQKVIDKKTGIVTYKVPPFWKDNPNLLFTRVNGEERIIAFNKNDERAMRLVTALRGMDAQKQAEVIKSMGTAGDYFRKALDFTGKTTRYFAAINTQYNPAFGIYNLMRDIGGATINLQTTPLKGMERKVVADAFVALKDVYKDLRRARDGLPPKSKWGQIFDDFGLQGGKSGFSELFRDSQERSDALQAELKKFNEGKLKGKGRAIMEWLSDFNDAIENAIRVSVYKNALDKGLSKQKAASLGKNITVNFNRKGSMSKHIQTLYAFFNAAVQGTARIAQTLMMPDGKLSTFGKRVVVGGITLGMMQAVLLAMAGIDEDELPDYIKDKSIVIPYGDGKYVSIPLPLGYHVIPAFGRRVMEFAMSDDKNVGKAMIGTAMMIADGFNPFGSATFLQTLSPTITDPLVALAENKDFNSKPIAIEDVSSMSPTPGYTRSSQNALAITKGIAYGINILSGGTEFKPGDISPTADQIEYLVGQLTGGVGREVMKIGRGAESVVTGEELATYNIPIIGRLIGNTQQKAAQRTRFYDNIKTMNEHQAEIEGRLKSNQDVTEYLKKYPEAAMYQEADKIYRKISALRSEKEYMKEAGESREAIKRVDDMILELMAGFNELQSRYSKEIKATQ